MAANRARPRIIPKAAALANVAALAQAPPEGPYALLVRFDGHAGVVYNPATMRIDRTRLFDKRVVQRNIRAGRVTKDEYAAWLAEVPDATDKIMAREDGGDDDGYEGAKPEEPSAPAPAAHGASMPVAAEPDHAKSMAPTSEPSPAAPVPGVTPEPPTAG